MLVIIQARLGGTRLPGKVQMDICGKQMIMHVWDRAKRFNAPMRIAWPNAYPRIHVDDVLSRFVACFEETRGLGPIVRLTADCPMLDTGLALGVIDRFGRGGKDLVATGPEFDGLDVEVFSSTALYTAHYSAHDPHDREHVTSWMRRNLNCEILHLDQPLRWSVDNAGALEFVRRVFRNCEHCLRGVPHHTNSASSIGGADRSPVWDLHQVDDGGLAECTSYDILKERIGGEVYKSV
jgi:spore coat polysaccharide biosynthesis protein SpsF (cytidylyltransferase family)